MKCLSIFLFLGLILTIAVASPSKRAEELSNIDDIEAELKENAMSAGASESDEDEDNIEEVLAQDEDGDDKAATLAQRLLRPIRCHWVYTYTNKYTCRFGHNSFTCRRSRVRQRRCRRRVWG